MFEKNDKRRLYQLIDMYLSGYINDKVFCDEFYYSYDLEIDIDTLTDIEKKELQDEGTTLLYETLLHQKYSRTYGGRNSTAQIAEDAQDLFKAAQKDMEALRKPLLESGMPEQDIEKAFELIHEMNRKKGLY